MRERVLHALDLGMLGDWDGAKRSLESVDDPIVPRLLALLTEQQRRDRERAEFHALVRHELGNAIAIAQANMEALIDGVLEPTPARLAGIRDALLTCGVLLDDLKKHTRAPQQTHARDETFDMCALVSAQTNLVQGIAETKNVSVLHGPYADHREAAGDYRGDPARVALIVRDLLLGAVRYTPPGGSIEVVCVRSNAEIELAVSIPESADGELIGLSLAKLLDTLGGEARILTDQPRITRLVVPVPAVPIAS